ncbi:MAG: hypothetical protein FJZ96_08960 [Chloroflexi bacterium]|nr:hypothetical protein [Chloroflexota bacterium]
MTVQPRTIIPIYTSRGDASAFLAYPYLFNPLGDWIGFVTAGRDVYSVLGVFVGTLTSDPRILRKRVLEETRPNLKPPPPPEKLYPPATVPLAKMMSELYQDTLDVLLDEPERLHPLDSGELRPDLD